MAITSKNFVAGALFGLLSTYVISTVQAAHTVESAMYVEGTLQSVDMQKGTFVVAGHEFVGASRGDLAELNGRVGQIIEVTYIDEGGRMKYLAAYDTDADAFVS